MELEQLYTIDTLTAEIVALWADAVIEQARALASTSGDIHSPEAKARRSERRRVKSSDAWLDRLIAERMALDAEVKKVP